MAITAFILNFNLTRGRKIYYPFSIAFSWLAFILWELYEWISVRVTVTPLGIGIDLWVDTLGALAMCFIYDEFMERD
jgi:polyferredoxin